MINKKYYPTKQCTMNYLGCTCLCRDTEHISLALLECVKVSYQASHQWLTKKYYPIKQCTNSSPLVWLAGQFRNLDQSMNESGSAWITQISSKCSTALFCAKIVTISWQGNWNNSAIYLFYTSKTRYNVIENQTGLLQIGNSDLSMTTLVEHSEEHSSDYKNYAKKISSHLFFWLDFCWLALEPTKIRRIF